MAVHTYKGSCHCGDVTFEADIDLEKSSGKCNCSICRKTRNWGVSIKPEAFRLLSPPDRQTDYQFNSNSVHWPFCKRCGVRTHGSGDIPEAGGKFVSVAVAALDGVSAETLAQLPVRYSNGRDNDWWHDVSDMEKRVL
jgi:hypothetical protein